jgi:hypothetical protein
MHHDYVSGLFYPWKVEKMPLCVTMSGTLAGDRSKLSMVRSSTDVTARHTML